jgi:hypothetical protein
MGLYDNMKRGFMSLIHPGEESSGKISIPKALSIYYPVAVIGLILALVMGYLSMSHSTALNYSGSYVKTTILLAAIYLIIIPIGIFIDAAIYHLIGKYLLKAWRGDYSKSFAAYTFVVIPFLSLYWIGEVPVLKIPITGIIAVWSIIMVVIAFASQHKINRTESAVVMIVTMCILLTMAFIVLGFITATALAPLSGGLGSPMAPIG